MKIDKVMKRTPKGGGNPYWMVQSGEQEYCCFESEIENYEGKDAPKARTFTNKKGTNIITLKPQSSGFTGYKSDTVSMLMSYAKDIVIQEMSKYTTEQMSPQDVIRQLKLYTSALHSIYNEEKDGN